MVAHCYFLAWLLSHHPLNIPELSPTTWLRSLENSGRDAIMTIELSLRSLSSLQLTDVLTACLTLIMKHRPKAGLAVCWDEAQILLKVHEQQVMRRRDSPEKMTKFNDVGDMEPDRTTSAFALAGQGKVSHHILQEPHLNWKRPNGMRHHSGKVWWWLYEFLH